MSIPKAHRFVSGIPASGRGLLKDHLAASEPFARLAGLAERLRQLQMLLDDALPASLAPGTRIATLKRGKLLIHADSGAVAVKLRQLTPRLAEHFIQQGQEVNGIEIKVQPKRRISLRTAKKTPKTLGIRPKRSLTCLAAGLPDDSPLRKALVKLLKTAKE